MKKLSVLFKQLKGLISVSDHEKKAAARTPHGFSLRDWRIALVETKKAIADKKLGILAAGIAYFSTLAFFPFVAASVAIASLFISDAQLHVVVRSLKHYLPDDIGSLIASQLEAAIGNEATNLVVAIIAIVIALVSVSSATKNLISGSNAAYECDESRGFVALRLTSIGMTSVAFVFGALVVGCLLLDAGALQSVGVATPLAVAMTIVRWPIIIALVAAALAMFYRYGPSRPNPYWQWVSWGAVIASLLWMLGTTAFFVYIKYFADFTASYSLFAGIIALMMWLNLSSFIILLGAQINHRLEDRTAYKTVQ